MKPSELFNSLSGKIFINDKKVIGLLAALIFILLFSFYVITACPTVYWYDSGEFNAAGFTLGVTHPTGYPLYVIMSKFWGTFFPLNSPSGKVHDFAYRCNIMSGFFGALSCALLFLIFMKIFASPAGQNGKQTKNKNLFIDIIGLKPSYDNFIILAGAFISLYTGIVPVYANLCTVSEVYTLHLFFIMLNINLLLIWEKSGDSFRSILLLYLISFLYGLSHANHMTSVLMAPAYLVFIIKKLKFKFLNPAYWLVPLLCFIAGFFPYIFTVEMSYNAVSWFPIRTFADFKYLFLAESYKNSLFVNKDIIANMAGGLFGWVFVFIKSQILLFYGFYIFVIAGIFYLLKNHRTTGILLSTGFFVNLLYFSNYIPNNQDFYLPVFSFTSVFLGIFFVYFYSYFIKDLKRNYRYLSITAFILVLVFMFTYQFRLTLTPADKLMDIGGKKTEGPNKIDYKAAYDNADRIAESVPDESTIIFHGDTMAPLLYLKYCTGYDENKYFYHSLLYHFRKYGPSSKRSWLTTLDEELIKPCLKSGKGVYVTLSDNSLYEDAVLYTIIKFIYDRNYDIDPVYDRNGFTSLGQITSRYVSKGSSYYINLDSLFNGYKDMIGNVEKPISKVNNKINLISINDELVIPVINGNFKTLVILFGIKKSNEMIDRIANISTGDEDHYIYNIIDCPKTAVNNENYFPSRKIFDRQNEIYIKYFKLKGKKTETIMIKRLNKDCELMIYGVGFEK